MLLFFDLGIKNEFTESFKVCVGENDGEIVITSKESPKA